jgi:hypothetical protein
MLWDVEIGVNVDVKGVESFEDIQSDSADVDEFVLQSSNLGSEDSACPEWYRFKSVHTSSIVAKCLDISCTWCAPSIL